MEQNREEMRWLVRPLREEDFDDIVAISDISGMGMITCQNTPSMDQNPTPSAVVAWLQYGIQLL